MLLQKQEPDGSHAPGFGNAPPGACLLQSATNQENAMAFIPAPGCAEVAVCYNEFDQAIQNVFHVHKSTPFDLAGLHDLAEMFQGWQETDIAPLQSSSVGCSLIIARALDSETAPAIEYTENLPVVGGQTTDPGLPANVTVAVKWNTGLRGRSYRGRTFHIGLCEGMVNGNKVNEAPAAAILGAYQTLLSMLSLSTMDLVVLSKYADKAPRTVAVATPIIGCSVDEWVDSQRRRLTGRGA